MALQTRTLGDDFFTSSLLGQFYPGLGLTTSGEDRQFVRNVPIDIVEKPTSYELKADLPGIGKEDIKLSVDNDVLTIAVEREAAKEETTEEGGIKYHRQERSSQFVRRSLRMPESADLSAVKAKYDNGVLALTIPKTEKARSHTVAVE